MTKAEAFFRSMQGKTVAVCGLGKNNTPVVHQFLEAGVPVLACDRRSRGELGGLAEELEAAGARLQLGERYLDGLGRRLADSAHAGDEALSACL